MFGGYQSENVRFQSYKYDLNLKTLDVFVHRLKKINRLT